MKVRLRIDSLVLDGLPVEAHQKPVLSGALHDELAGRLSEAQFYQSVHIGRARTFVPPFSPGEPKQVGREVGRAIHGSISRNAE